MHQRLLSRQLWNGLASRDGACTPFASTIIHASTLTPVISTCIQSLPRRQWVFVSQRASLSTTSYRQDNATNSSSSSSTKTLTDHTNSDNHHLFDADSAKSNSHYFPDGEEEQPDFHPDTHTSLPRDFGVNQIMSINEELRERLRQVLWQFKAPIRYAVAYGSGVFSQGKGHSSSKDGESKPQIDMLFGVTYTDHWHSLNLMQHRSHYSGLGVFGSGVVGYVQDRIGAGVYFNPYVEMNGMVRSLRLVLTKFERERGDKDEAVTSQICQVVARN